MSVEEPKLVVGSDEWCALPDLNIPAVKARVDSGAKTSALHAFNIHAFKRGGKPWVSFEIHPLQQNRKVMVRCEALVVDRRLVKSTSGNREKRYIISTQISLGGRRWDIEVSLTNRDHGLSNVAWTRSHARSNSGRSFW